MTASPEILHLMVGANVDPARSVLENLVLAGARTIANLRETDGVEPILTGLYDLATDVGRDDVAEGLADCSVAWSDGLCGVDGLVDTLRELSRPEDDDHPDGVILCLLCRVYGLGHDGDHLVP